MRSQVGQAVMTQYGTCGVLSSVESSVQRGVEVFTAGLASQLHHWLLQQRRHGGWSVSLSLSLSLSLSIYIYIYIPTARTLSNDTRLRMATKASDPQGSTRMVVNKDGGQQGY